MIRIDPPLTHTVGFAEYLQAHSQYIYKLKKEILRKENQTIQEWTTERQEAERGNY